MNLKELISKADGDIDLAGAVTFSEDEWRTIRNALATGSRNLLADQLRKLLKHFGVITYAKHHRQAIAEAKQTLKDLGEPVDEHA